MKRTILGFVLAGLALAMTSSVAGAGMGGVGFHTTDAPIGVRHWFTDMVAGDLGVGFTTTKHEVTVTNKTTNVTVDAGVPICVKKLDKLHFIVRPGVLYANTKDEPPTGPSIKTTEFDVTGEVEAEYWLTDKLSISASEGVAFGSASDDQTPKTKDTIFTTTGNNFTTLGFHVYLW
jgi:hypothetical protein